MRRILVTPLLVIAVVALAVLLAGGDGSMPWRPSEDYNCDPTQLPVGP